MNKIEHFMLPEHTNTLYEKEAISSIELTKEVADKLNEIIDSLNGFGADDLAWKQEQEGIIRKGVLYMKDNLINSLHDLLKLYDSGTLKKYVLETYGKELEQIRYFITPQMFGAVGDGVTNDIEAIEKAIESMNEGEVLYFPKGTYLMTGHKVEVYKNNVTFTGEGLIKTDFGFEVTASNFKAFGVRMEGTTYSENCRAFNIKPYATYIKNFTFKDCQFKNFFYAVSAVGGSYNFDGTEEETGYRIRDFVIENCYSETYTDNNTGHFQAIQVENISYINNRTYGGTNASSYNAIKGNGYIRVIGNYDHNNTYASCEIENGSGKCVIANNTFNSKIWVDDSFDVVVNANTTEEGILITVGSGNGDTKNVIISNNNCRNIRCEQFGTYVGGVINNININGNSVKGDNTHGIWLHGNAVKNAKVFNNFITGSNVNDISVQRNAQIVCYIQGNFGNGKNLLIAGSGGTVYALDNYNVTVSGTRNSLPVSHYERSFNGIKMTDSDSSEWRLNVSSTGNVYATRY